MNNNSIRFDQSGFTLLELLLVVTLLSTTAFMTLSAVENNSDQIRFEDTRNRLSLFEQPFWEVTTLPLLQVIP